MARFARLALWRRSHGPQVPLGPQGRPAARPDPAPPGPPEDPATAALRRYLAWCDRRLEAVAITEGLHLRLVGAVEGPQTITLRVRLAGTPTRADLRRLLTLGGAIGQALQTGAARIAETAGGVEIELPHPHPWTPDAAELARHTHGLQRLAIGLDAYRRPVALDLTAAPHILAVGPTRRGKSAALAAALYGLALVLPPRRLAYLVLAKKAASWAPFAPAAGCLGVITDPAEQEAALAWLVEVLDQRAATGTKAPAILVLADDWHNLTAGAALAEPMAYLAALGGELAIHCWLTAQTTGTGAGFTQALEQNLTSRLIFGAGDSAAAARFAGRGGTGAELAGRHPGDAILIRDGEPQRVATAWLDPRLAAMLPPGELPQPWRERVYTANTTNTGVHRPAATPQARANAATPDALPVGGEMVYTGVAGVDTAYTPPTPWTPDHLPTPAEAAYIRAYRAGHSLNQTTAAIYGSKNARTCGLVKVATGADLSPVETAQIRILAPEYAPSPQNGPGTILLAADGETDHPTAAEALDGLPTEIDLETADGRALLGELWRSGELHWPSEE